ncbi:hypothetical protein LTR56_002585 [Elasticomyces elasticus]|nr:hypothetical protein LTR22_013487 [Elasticomyces elasticus]KAK3657071.1 hypothetical protein LTR56_002585 [Elasticomyces elasticus]KAK4926700.1 hypothetical protein LTR49_006382 [Elasticomyces elasticus]KAK5762349.1 hypothetical protein LTS12_007508 [Elasticomyces elasticus]
MVLSYCISALTLLGLLANGQDLCPVPNNYNYHNSAPQTIRSFQGIYHSNFNETITFCNFKPKQWELETSQIIPVLAQTAYGGPPYTKVGAVLTGSVYVAGNGSIVWNGFGFSASGPYNCGFALSSNGSTADGYYTYTDQKNGSSPAGETGPWLLSFYREATWGECALVYRGYTARDYETGCVASSE